MLLKVGTHSVNTSPLLEEHGNGGNDDALEHGLGLEQRCNGHKLQLEDVHGSLLGEVGERLGNGALLKHGLSLDLEELEFDQLVVRGKITERGEVLAGLVFPVVVHQPTRRKGHPDHTDEQDKCWDKLDANGHQPGCVGLGFDRGAANVVCSVVDPETDHDAKGNSELLKCDESTTDLTIRSQFIVLI